MATSSSPAARAVRRLARELELGGDLDRTAYAPGHRAPCGMKAVRPFGSIPLVVWATGQCVVNANPFDHKHLVFQDDITFRLRAQPSLAGVDPTRIQRAPEGPRESTCGSGYYVVKSGRVVGVLA